jgi:hypothetical protein
MVSATPFSSPNVRKHYKDPIYFIRMFSKQGCAHFCASAKISTPPVSILFHSTGPGLCLNFQTVPVFLFLLRPPVIRKNQRLPMITPMVEVFFMLIKN